MQISRVSHLACIVARLYCCSQITGDENRKIIARAHRSSRVSLVAYYAVREPGNHSLPEPSLARTLPRELRGGGLGNRRPRASWFAHQGGEDQTFTARVFHSPRASQLACIVAGTFITLRTRYRIVGRADGGLRVLQQAG